MQRDYQHKDAFIQQEEGEKSCKEEKNRCPKCGLQLKENMVYCPHCGTQYARGISEDIQKDVGQDFVDHKVETWPVHSARPIESGGQIKSTNPRRCHVCGLPLKEEAIYCSKCGTLCTEDQDDHDDNGEKRPKKSRGGPWRLVLILIAALALVILIAAAIFIIRNRLNSEDGNREEAESTAFAQWPAESVPIQVTPTPWETSPAWTVGTYAPTLASPEPTETPLLSPGPFTTIQEGQYQLYTADKNRSLSIDAGDAGTIWLGWEMQEGGDIFQISRAMETGAYSITGLAGTLGVSQNGEELQLAQANGKWSFATATGQGYYICLTDYPGYVLGYSRGTPAIEAYDPDSTMQQWVLVQGQPMALEQGTEIEQWLADFIPTLDDTYIAAEDIYGLDQTTLGYIRNGIYALSGKIFETKAYQDFFSRQPWYIPYSQDGGAVKKRFNDYQNHNLTICLEYEREMGWR